MEEEGEPGDAQEGLLSLPPLLVEAIAAALYPDARAAAALSASCRALRAVAATVDWGAWLARRFGRDTLPATPLQGAGRGGAAACTSACNAAGGRRAAGGASAPPPPLRTPGPVKAEEVEGFVFVQGMEPPGAPARALGEGAPLAATVQAARAAGAKAFTSGGNVYADAPPADELRRASLDPRRGLYVAAVAARSLGLDTSPRPQGAASAPSPPFAPPRPGRSASRRPHAERACSRVAPPPRAALEAWPPPRAGGAGWVYFGGVDAGAPLTGRRPAPNILQHAASVEQLLARAGAMAGAVAVTTRGDVLSATTLRPPELWRPRPDWAQGVWVQAAMVSQLGVQPAEAHAPEAQGAWAFGFA